MTWTTRFYRWLYRSRLGRLFFDDMDAVVADLSTTRRDLDLKTAELGLATGLLELRDAQYAKLADRARAAEDECVLWRALWNKSMPTRDAS